MEELAKSVTELIRGTAIENNELELAKLKRLPLEEQVEVGIVLRSAMLRGREHPEPGNGELGVVSSVAEAQHLLDKAGEAHPRTP